MTGEKRRLPQKGSLLLLVPLLARCLYNAVQGTILFPYRTGYDGYSVYWLRPAGITGVQLRHAPVVLPAIDDPEILIKLPAANNYP
jgi:hypothetical protein